MDDSVIHRGGPMCSRLRAAALVAALAVSAGPAAAQTPVPAMDVTARAVAPGEPLGVTATGTPGEHYVILGSTTGAGLTFDGQALAVGPDSRVMAAGVFDGTGRALHLVVPPFLGTVLDRFYLQVAASPSFTFTPLRLSAGIVVLNTDLLTGLIAGPAGPAGPAGATGPAGTAGANGVDGAPGPAGPQGAAGAAGGSGPAGPAGLTGPAGPSGAAGASGAPGAPGAAGTPGEVGPTGPHGVAGPQGLQGLQGPPGATGAIGPAGATGATGATGPRGDAGISSVLHALHVERPEVVAGGDPVAVLVLRLDAGDYLVSAKISVTAVTYARISCQLEQDGTVLDRASLSLFERSGEDEDGTLTLTSAASMAKGAIVTVRCGTPAKTGQVLDRTLTALAVGRVAEPQ